MSLKKVVKAIKKHDNFLITAHTNLEGDALGAELSFFMLLKKLGKNAIIVNEDPVPYGYEFMPGLNNIKRFNNSPRWKVNFDCFVALDCSDPRRTGEVYKLNKEHKPVINIDHHISNERFGDVNWVDAHASSASEMVYHIYKEMNVRFDRDCALCLYIGILTDTGSFRYSNTSSVTHKAVAELLKFDLNVSELYNHAYGNIPFQDAKLLTKILPGIRREVQGKIIWFQVKQNILRNKKIYLDLTDQLLSFARLIKDVEVVVLFKENLGVKDEIRINFRSNGAVDVNAIAKLFGGGGHRTASGATVRGKIESIRKKVIAKIKEAL